MGCRPVAFSEELGYQSGAVLCSRMGGRHYWTKCASVGSWLNSLW